MSDTPEIPEAKDRFETTVAITIAVAAVILSWISNRGDDAKTGAIIKTNEAANKWGHFQSKSIKERMVETTLDLASSWKGRAGEGDPPVQLANWKSEIDRYRSEKGTIEKEAAQLQEKAAFDMRVNDRCGLGCLILQIAIVISSVSILARSKFLWMGGIVLAVVGSVIGISSHFM